MGIKYTIGKQLIEPFFCPKCQEQSGEQQIGRDRDCPLRHRKRVVLCYKCGYSSTTIEKY